MPKPKTKTVPCSECGADITVGWKTRTAKRCHECGMKAMMENLYSMDRRSGPEYEKWLKAYRAALTRLESATPPPP